MNIKINYPAGHSITHVYEKSDYYCPSCGSKTVWEEQGEGDYYTGVNYACTSCKTIFCLPIVRSGPDKIDDQIFSAILAKHEV